MEVNIIPPRVPFIDPRTNTIAREWYLFLLRAKTEIMDMPSSGDNVLAGGVFAAHTGPLGAALYITHAEPILATQVFGG